MSVATWLKSVFTTQTATNYKSNVDACFAVAERIVDNFAPRQTTAPAMTVTLDAGALYNGQTLTEVAAQTTGTITAPVANPRIDRIVIDKTSGAVSVITGTPAGSPAAPALTAGVFPVAQVLLQTTSTTITNSMITDERTAALTAVAAHIAAAPNKTTPVGADVFGIWDSVTGLLNKLTLTNLATYLGTVCSAGWNALTATTAATVSTTVASGAVGTTQAVNDSSTKMATTAFANPAATIGSSGSVELPSGLIIKWGYLHTGNIGGAGPTIGTITYPVAFPNATLSVQTTIFDTSVTVASVTHIRALAAASFTYGAEKWGAITVDNWLYWVAIGY